MNPDKAFQAYREAVEHNDSITRASVIEAAQDHRSTQCIQDTLNESRFWLDYLMFRHKQGKYLSPKQS